MVINGRPGLACARSPRAAERISLHPLPGFALIADLSVDTGTWMRELAERLETWVHLAAEPDLDLLEAPMSPGLAEEIHELDRCIECGCCIAACGTAQMRPVSSARSASTRSRVFRLDPPTVATTRIITSWSATTRASSAA